MIGESLFFGDFEDMFDCSVDIREFGDDFETRYVAAGQDHESMELPSRYDEVLRSCDDFQDVFALVKRIAGECFGVERSSMVLELVDLPLHVGAAHPVGTNRIVMNQALLDLAVRNRSIFDVKAFVFSILLHEYIHALGCLNELETRRLVFAVSKNAFGSGHLVTRLALYGPWHIFRSNPQPA